MVWKLTSDYSLKGRTFVAFELFMYLLKIGLLQYIRITENYLCIDLENSKPKEIQYTHSLVPAVFSGAVFTCAFFQKCYFYYIS